jgi:metallo-beta-lactamase family protein
LTKPKNNKGDKMKIRFLGAARKVTGSCFHLAVNGLQILVDCGMNQGKSSDELNRMAFAFDPGRIDYLFSPMLILNIRGSYQNLLQTDSTVRS